MNATQSLLKKFVLIAITGMSFKAHALSPIIDGPAYPPEVKLEGNYLFENKNLRFTLNISVNQAYPILPVIPGTVKPMSSSDAICPSLNGGQCRPIAIVPPPPGVVQKGKYIAQISAESCSGWATANTNSSMTNYITESGLIKFNRFSLMKNVIVEPPTGVTGSPGDTIQPDAVSSYDLFGRPKRECHDARLAAQALEKVVEYKLTLTTLSLKMKSGRVLKLQRIVTMGVPRDQ